MVQIKTLLYIYGSKDKLIPIKRFIQLKIELKLNTNMTSVFLLGIWESAGRLYDTELLSFYC